MVSLIFCLGCRCLPFRCVLSMFYAWITVNLVFPVPKHLVSHRGDVGLGRMDSVCKGEWKGGKKILEPESFQSWFLIIFFLIAAETSQIKQFENIFMLCYDHKSTALCPLLWWLSQASFCFLSFASLPYLILFWSLVFSVDMLGCLSFAYLSLLCVCCAHR